MEVQDTFRGLTPPVLGEGPAGVALAAGAQVTTSTLSVNRTEGFGIFQDATGAASHSALQVRKNDQSGLWVQRAAAATVVTGVTFFQNRLAGLVAIDSAPVSLIDSSVGIVNASVLPVPEHFADGVQVVRTPAAITNSSIRVTERVSVLLDLAADRTLEDFVLGDVLVQGQGQSLGLVAQDAGGPLPLIEAGVTRRGAVKRTDAEPAVTGERLGVTGVINPCFLPAAEAVAKDGLAALLP